MYTQIIIVLFSLHSLSAYAVVKIEVRNGSEESDAKELCDNTIEFISDGSKLPILREIIFVVDSYIHKNCKIKKNTPQEMPIELDGSLRTFTNGHGYQFADWKLVDEHQSRADDKAEDKNDDHSDKNRNSASDDADKRDDTAGDETDKHDDYDEDTDSEIPEIDPRHLDIDRAKALRNKKFDEMKEKYQSNKKNKVDPIEKVRRKRQLLNNQNTPEAPEAEKKYIFHPTAIPFHMDRILLMNRPPHNNPNNGTSPGLRDEKANILRDNKNAMYSGSRKFGKIPRAYGINLNNDQSYSLNSINNMQNQPTCNQHISQSVQQRPIESNTMNINRYKEIKQSNTPNVKLRRVKQLPISEINEIDYKQKLNQIPNYGFLNKVSKETEYKNKNISPGLGIEKARNNGEANTMLRNNKEMLNNFNQMSNNIKKEKDNDKFVYINRILNTPEARKLLYYRIESNFQDITTPYVNVNNFIPPDSKNLTTYYDNIKMNPNNTIGINNVEDANFNGILNATEGKKQLTHEKEKEKTIGDKGEILNDAAVPQVLVSNFVPEDTKNLTIDDNIEANHNNTIDINYADDANLIVNNNCSNNESSANNSLIEVAQNIDINSNEEVEIPVENTMSSNTIHVINQNNNEATTNQTIVDNECKDPEPPVTEIHTTTFEEATSNEIDKDEESTLDPLNIESFDDISSTEIKEEKCKELIEETKTETFVANETNEENCNNKENCKDDKKSENLNFDELFNKVEFWDWLSKWTTAYMEILNENVEIIVKGEVAKQLEENMFWKTEKGRVTNHSEKATIKKS